VLVVGLAITAAVLLNQISERIRIPAAAIILVAAELHRMWSRRWVG
jgi:hypothetical protein